MLKYKAFQASIGVKNANFFRLLPESTGGQKANGAQLPPHNSIPTLAPNANKNSKSIKTNIPLTQSTTTRAPSVTLRAAVTSDEKSTCPGESIKLMRKALPVVSWSFKNAISASLNS